MQFVEKSEFGKGVRTISWPMASTVAPLI